jgi:hypothetical protein
MGVPEAAGRRSGAAAQAGLRAFFRIAQLWGLSAEEQRTLLGDPPRSTYYKWKKGDAGSVSRDVLERISYVLGIFKALEILLPRPESADGWIRRPNDAPPFGGRSALDRMLSGNVGDLYAVRQYLDAARSGWA